MSTRRRTMYALSLLALAFLIVLGISAWYDPEIRDRRLRVAPKNEQELLDFGLLRPSSLPLFWSNKGAREGPSYTSKGIVQRVTWRNALMGDPPAYVQQEIWEYPTEKVAITAYAARVAEVFYRGRNNEVAWIVPPDLHVPAHADQASLHCNGDENDFSGWDKVRAWGVPAHKILQPMRHCILVARYAGLVVELRTNLFQQKEIRAARFQSLITELVLC